MTRQPQATRPAKEGVLLCGLLLGNQQPEHEGDLAEIRGLVEAADGVVVGPSFIQRRARPDSATLLGKGKVEEIAEGIRSCNPDAVAVDKIMDVQQVVMLDLGDQRRDMRDSLH